MKIYGVAFLFATSLALGSLGAAAGMSSAEEIFERKKIDISRWLPCNDIDIVDLSETIKRAYKGLVSDSKVSSVVSFDSSDICSLPLYNIIDQKGLRDILNWIPQADNREWFAHWTIDFNGLMFTPERYEKLENGSQKLYLAQLEAIYKNRKHRLYLAKLMGIFFSPLSEGRVRFNYQNNSWKDWQRTYESTLDFIGALTVQEILSAARASGHIDLAIEKIDALFDLSPVLRQTSLLTGVGKAELILRPYKDSLLLALEALRA
jgi:hypothetical protein